VLLTDLDLTLRAAGLTVHEVPGWKSRGRPGGMSDIRTIACHHTAGPATGDHPSLNIVRDGRAGLPGPLAQLFLARGGDWYVVAAGLSNHAGAVLSVDFSNPHAVGIEAEATGVDSWPEGQYESYAVGCRALVERYGLKIADVKGHKEICDPPGRKIDPNFNMDKFRDKVRSINLMAITADDARRVHQTDGSIVFVEGDADFTPGGDNEWKASTAIRRALNRTANIANKQTDLMAEVRAARTEVADLRSELDQLNAHLAGLDPGSIAAIAVQALREEISKIQIRIQTGP